jgi:DNA ligase-1
MRDFAELCESISRTTKKLEKTRLVAEFIKSLPVDEAAHAAVFLSGRAFPAYEETVLSVGGALLSRLLQEVTGATGHQLTLAYRRHGDLGSAAFDLYSEKRIDTPSQSEITLHELESAFRKIAAASGAAKTPIIRDLLLRASPLEAKYLIKFMGGDLRIGLRESLVEEAIGKAFEEPHDLVRRANMLLGDIGAVLRYAAAHQLNQARMRLFHPIGAMLASPTENAADALSYFPDPARLQIEDKYDGIRAQVHCGADVGTKETRVAIFSRTMDNITESFPELAEALKRLSEDVILDGEILAWESNAGERGASAELHEQSARAKRSARSPGITGRALPFTHIQQRLGRKSPSAELIRQYPVAYMAFDVIYANGDLIIEKPLRERRKILESLFEKRAGAPPARSSQVGRGGMEVVVIPAAGKSRTKKSSSQQDLFADPTASDAKSVPLPPRVLAPTYRASSPEELDQLFDAAQTRGNEGLMLKDLDSLYTPGRRGKSWLKVKRELAPLELDVTGVEFGHGKRAGVLSDYTFAVRGPSADPDAPKSEFTLLNVGKAYSGLTDREIADMTEWFKAHTREDRGFFRTVDPEIVLEVAFNNVMESDRHESGYALRFPRIMRLRPDKPVAEIDTLERVRELFENQHKK